MEKTAPAITVDTSVVIKQAVVTFLDGRVNRTRSPKRLAKLLEDAYLHPRPNEELVNSSFIRFGFRQIMFEMEVAHQPLALIIGYDQHWQWTGFRGPQIGGKAKSSYSSWRPKNGFSLVVPTGEVLAKFFKRLHRGIVTGLITQKYSNMASLSHTTYVCLELQPSKGHLATGRLDLYEDYARGDTYRWLFEAEGGYSDRGRGDHVGSIYN